VVLGILLYKNYRKAAKRSRFHFAVILLTTRKAAAIRPRRNAEIWNNLRFSYLSNRCLFAILLVLNTLKGRKNAEA